MFNKILQSITSEQKKWIAIVLGSLFIIMVALGGYAYSKREAMLSQAIQKAKIKLNEKYDMDLRIGFYSFKGLATVRLKDIYIQPKDRAQLAEIKDLEVSVRLWPLLFGEVKLGQIFLDRGNITLVKQDSLSNYDFLFKKTDPDTSQTQSETNLAEVADKLLKSVFFKIPSDMEVKDFELSYRDDSISQRISMPYTLIDGGDIQTALILNNQEAKWNIEGHVNPDKKQLRLGLSAENKNVELPLLKNKFGLSVRFERIEFNLQEAKRKNKELLALTGEWDFSNLIINHWRLSDRDILIPSTFMHGELNIGQNSIEVSDKTILKVKEFECHPYLKYVHKPNKQISLGLHTDKIVAQTFFDAIPEGLFESLEGIQVAGDIQYDLKFEMDFNKPNDLIFSSQMNDQELKIIKWGKADIQKLNTDFIYTAYEDGKAVRDIRVGPSNPNFTPLGQISRNMKISLLNSEDPFFMRHNGFQEEAFRLSIATNIKEKRFKRGASTVSMQLVKNVFLNRNKTVVRKLEEIILVWLMERSGQVSKDRMYEVYLNVIEWGRNIYGITEAARFYFGKSPAELTLGESIYLSSIVPRPKTGLYSFDYTGHLKPNMLRYFNTYGSILAKTGQISVDTTVANYGFYQVQLQPHLRPARPAGLIDSLEQQEIQEEFMMDQEEKMKRSIFDKIFGKKKEEDE